MWWALACWSGPRAWSQSVPSRMIPLAWRAIAWLTRPGAFDGMSLASRMVTFQPSFSAAAWAASTGMELEIETWPELMMTIDLFLAPGRGVGLTLVLVPA